MSDVLQRVKNVFKHDKNINIPHFAAGSIHNEKQISVLDNNDRYVLTLFVLKIAFYHLEYIYEQRNSNG